MIPWWGWPLRWASGLSVWIYTHLATRVRFFGRFPAREAGALIISNHQNDRDLMAFTALGFLSTLPRAPLMSATAKVLFEPGFMAVRIPWLWRILRNLNMGWFFVGVGLLPIENELQSRSIGRWAFGVERLHGPLALDQIFKPAVIERYGLQGLSTRDLFRPQYFRTGQETYVRITELLPAIGKEQLEEAKRGVADDMAAMEDALRRGAIFYVTPEGAYTITGAMLPFRAIWDRLEPLARAVYVAAISYDPFNGPRFSQIYRLAPLGDRARARTELAAARVVTVSAILSAWMLERDAAFTAEEAKQAVVGRVHSLPAGVFADPELLESPQRLTERALEGLLRYGIVARTGEGYLLAAERKHPNYPEVADIVDFQSRFLKETLTAAEELDRLASGREHV